ncbi:MAG: YHS domain-containing (seleno)protein [Hyphomicrobium aestuarii]|nr:YHS domain-containing (seleno)protein [Hyphomicrobium aestuarii]
MFVDFAHTSSAPMSAMGMSALGKRLIWLIAFAAVAFAHVSASAGPAPISTAGDKLAVSGYDPVGYFASAKPVKGSADITAVHDGVTWRFANAANRTAFLAEPAKFTPQYGGYCAWAVSQGYTAASDPNVWKIVDGKLYLNYNRSVGRNWEANAAANISRANANWPKIVAK